MAINTWLLVCKASRISSILCQTHAKSESLLSNFSSIQIISKEGHPTLVTQELQTIKCIEQHTSITNKIIKLAKSSTWWLPQTSGTHIWESRQFESMYNLQEKTWPTRHVRFPRQSTYALRTLPVGGLRMWQPFMSHWLSATKSLLLRKGAPETINSASAVWSMGPYPVSLLSQPMKQWRKPNIYRP
jgi:hypothetical protein